MAIRLALSLGAITILLAGCSDQQPEIPVATITETATVTAAPETSEVPSAAAPLGKLRFRVTGSCTNASGVLKAEASGFTPEGSYNTNVFYPNGRRYPAAAISNPGRANQNGQTPGWTWDCSLGAEPGLTDPPGIYRYVITDLETGRKIEGRFRVKPA